MILWIAFAVVAAAAVAVLARPLLAEQHGVTASAQEADLAVYRDQLAEIDADRDRGLIDSAEAESARTELARRLLQRSEQSDDAAQAAASLPKSLSPATIAYATALAIPVLSIAIYLALGSPSMPGMPQSARLHHSPAQAGIDELVAKVEAQLRETPEDGRGWDAIAPVYLRLQRFGDASNAFARAIRLLGETPKRLRGFAESTVLANNGIVVEPARLAYQQLLTKEPGDHEARFWLAMADEQEGKLDAAEKGYRSVLTDAPEDAPWKSVVEARIATIAAQRSTTEATGNSQSGSKQAAGGQSTANADAGTKPSPPETSGAKPPGPTSADIAAARELSKDDQQAFINAMVERLAGKLDKNPDDFEGWLRLVRAYSVLGRKDDAGRALVSARKNAEGNSERNARLDALAAELGLGI
ncbi:MAG: c-type cytochrome biogenesis protein CcmI [Alphaproteobacteria bacterium]|nr:c-type cytochrome biogenesis protein CcmI [Alphaproteobacteria bacterium]